MRSNACVVSSTCKIIYWQYRTYASLQYLNGTDIYTLKNQLGHSKITQTEEYIKDIVEASERRSRLKGTGIICDLECIRTIDAKNEQ